MASTPAEVDRRTAANSLRYVYVPNTSGHTYRFARYEFVGALIFSPVALFDRLVALVLTC